LGANGTREDIVRTDGSSFHEDPRADGTDERVVFLDVETTGLNAGAGTLVFLVGVAWFAGDVLVVEQFLLHDPSVERALLSKLAERLQQFAVVVTFNGKRFDVPLLTGRYDLHRLADPLPSDHVDLLHPARRVWSRRLGQSTLAALETRVLGLVRESDIVGSDVPRRYFDFLRDGRIDLLTPVLEHNRLDLRAMAALGERLDRLLGDCGARVLAHPSDLLGLGQLLASAGRVDDGRRCYEAALVGASPSERATALYRLAGLIDRRREPDKAVDLLTAVTEYQLHLSVLASVELAKIHEHRSRDPARALSFARRARELHRSGGFGRVGVAAVDLDHRIARLERKVASGVGSSSATYHSRD
jgi:uncharacterized protein YprB with RNaseH-like and TPR domain